MPENLKNILWMAEEMDFGIEPTNKPAARTLVNQFLEVTGNRTLSHWLYRANR